MRLELHIECHYRHPRAQHFFLLQLKKICCTHMVLRAANFLLVAIRFYQTFKQNYRKNIINQVIHFFCFRYGKSWQQGLYDLNNSHPILPLRFFGIKRDPCAILLTCYILILSACGFLEVTISFAPYIATFSILMLIPYLFAHVLYACGFVLYRIIYITVCGVFFLIRGFCIKLISLFLPRRLVKFIFAKASQSKLSKKSSDVSQNFSDEDDEQPSEGAEGAPKNAERRYVFYSSDESDY